MKKLKKFKENKKVFMLFGNNLLNSVEWNQKDTGKEMEAGIIKVGVTENDKILSLTYSSKQIGLLKYNPDKNKDMPVVTLKEEDETFNFIKVRFNVSAETTFRLSYLEDGEFKTLSVSRDELFDMLEQEQAKTMEFLKNKIEMEW